MLQWLPLIVHLQPPSGAHEIRFDRFSPYHERPADYGLTLGPRKEYSYVYPLSPELMNELAYFFEDSSQLNGNGNGLTGRDHGIIPEYKALRELIAQWKKLFQSKFPPLLNLIDDDGERLRIVDTRPCATDYQLSLEGLAYSVYVACDRALTPRMLVDTLSEKYRLDVSWNNTQPIVEELRASKIMLEFNGRLLSLAVRGPIPPLPKQEEFPGGYIDIRRYIRDTCKS